ncbi:MAG: hypothetical protein IT459_11260 [Planctomycetes bacterium]|nr:hypothetical protein [Planctomycetota bacterium]
MSALALVTRRFLERRLLGDGDDAASPVPAAATTLTVSTLVFLLLAQDRSPFETFVLMNAACLAWSAVRTFFEARELDATAADRGVLEPLPIAAWTFAAARALVLGAELLVGTLNVALPPIMITAVVVGPAAAARAFVAALCASLTGLALATFLRAVLLRFLGARKLEEWEGPIRLVVAVALFAALFAAPDLDAAARASGFMPHLPPLAFARFCADGGDWIATALAATAMVALLGAAFSLARARRTNDERRGTGGDGPVASLARRFLAADERAGYEFTRANLARDRTFRARVFPLFAFPFAAIVLLAKEGAGLAPLLISVYGASMYLVVAQTFVLFSESQRGPRLVEALPILDAAAFRAGAEKAFHAHVVIPVHLTVLLGLAALAVFERGPGLSASAQHVLLGALFAILFGGFFFERLEGLAFCTSDDGKFPASLQNRAFAALLLSTVAALVGMNVVGRPVPYALAVLALALMIRLRLRRRSA